MGAPTTKDEFVPFVPRQLAAIHCAPQPPAIASEPAPEIQQPPEAIASNSEAVREVETAAQIEFEHEADVVREPPERRSIACNHECLIRAEAIKLAIIACGRALRHVAAVHPKLVASFVDDALAAAGSPKDMSIESTLADRISDAGEVSIDFGDCHIGADLPTRAELLVRAAADASC
jgi:hypothetical protein